MLVISLLPKSADEGARAQPPQNSLQSSMWMANSQCILDKFVSKNMSRESKTFNVQHLRAIADVGSCSLVPCQAMQMHQQHTAQLEMLRAAKLAEAINQKAPRDTLSRVVSFPGWDEIW